MFMLLNILVVSCLLCLFIFKLLLPRKYCSWCLVFPLIIYLCTMISRTLILITEALHSLTVPCSIYSNTFYHARVSGYIIRHVNSIFNFFNLCCLFSLYLLLFLCRWKRIYRIYHLSTCFCTHFSLCLCDSTDALHLRDCYTLWPNLFPLTYNHVCKAIQCTSPCM